MFPFLFSEILKETNTLHFKISHYSGKENVLVSQLQTIGKVRYIRVPEVVTQLTDVLLIIFVCKRGVFFCLYVSFQVVSIALFLNSHIFSFVVCNPIQCIF